ncbi:MAG: PilN domain-containing protein [Acidobacteriota bacterium]
MISASLRKWLAFGSGIGISIEGPRGAETLRVTAVRVRPTGARVIGGFTVEDYRNQPAADWGAVYAATTAKLGLKQSAATVLLPRHEVILRQVSLPGVPDKDLNAAIAFQLDGLHPYDEGDVVSSWARLEGSEVVLVAIARREAIDAYTTLFAEAGVKLAGFTCGAAAVYSALRLWGSKPAAEILAMEPLESGVEVYGESAAKPMLAATFDVEPDRAAGLAAAELRLEHAPAPVLLSELLHADPAAPYAAALSSAYPMGSLALNLLPVELRQARSALQWAPTVILAVAVLLAAIGLALFPRYWNGSYLDTLNQEIAKLQPAAMRAGVLDREVQATRARTLLLDEMRRHDKDDMDVLAALTNLLAPPTWLRSLELSPQQVNVAGEADQAQPLLKAIDDSNLFEGSEFSSPPSRQQGAETFGIRTRRSAVNPSGASQ